MLDIKFIRENPELVKENIRKKYQDSKLPLVDEVIDAHLFGQYINIECDFHGKPSSSSNTIK